MNYDQSLVHWKKIANIFFMAEKIPPPKFGIFCPLNRDSGVNFFPLLSISQQPLNTMFQSIRVCKWDSFAALCDGFTHVMIKVNLALDHCARYCRTLMRITIKHNIILSFLYRTYLHTGQFLMSNCAHT